MTGQLAPLDLRRAIGEVMAHPDNQLRDDATTVWLSWDPAG